MISWLTVRFQGSNGYELKGNPDSPMCSLMLVTVLWVRQARGFQVPRFQFLIQCDSETCFHVSVNFTESTGTWCPSLACVRSGVHQAQCIPGDRENKAEQHLVFAVLCDNVITIVSVYLI